MIKINLEKAQEIAHEVRRAKRNEDFKPLDVQATIPALAVEAEAKRQAIRDEDNKRQDAINKASDEKALKEIVDVLLPK